MTDHATTQGLRGRLTDRGGRGDRSPLGTWFWDTDRVLLLLTFALIAVGLLSVAAASPATAMRYSGEQLKLPPLHYFWRQVMWVAVSLPVVIGLSMLPVNVARRAAVIGAAMFSFMLVLVLIPGIGVEVNGAKRWLGVGISQFQPSEFLKPCFIVTVAWLLSLRTKEEGLPLTAITFGMTATIGALLMLQPDFGQTMVFGLVWMTLLVIAGTPTKTLATFLAMAPLGVGAAYMFYGTARTRIDSFLFRDPNEAEGAHFQTDAAHRTLTSGGWTGTGPGAGTSKFGLPEAHTDYIFSVIGEEFGLIACMVIALLFLAIVARVFVKMLDEQDSFKLLAASGLATQFGLQALISMAVNTGLAPSKGMTLPFISYGGSSMIALSIGMGLLLTFTRRNPFLLRSPYVARWGRAA